MEKINCPICFSENIKFSHNKNGYQIYVCGDCEVGFVYPIPSDIDGLYEKKYFKNEGGEKSFGYKNYDKDKEPLKNLFIKYIKIFEKMTGGRKIFDVGCATGYFLDLARARSWQTFGVDISKYATEIAEFRGHKIWHGKLDKINLVDKFDVVIMWDILEHLHSPEVYLKKINQLIVKDGILFINTINRKSFWACLWGKRWHAIVPPEHLFYFSPKSIVILLKKKGFKIEKISREYKRFSLAYIFKILYNWQGIEMWKKLSNFFDNDFFRKIYIPIYLGDNISIIARKKEDV